METPKITPENCHRIKQTVCGTKIKAVFYDPSCYPVHSFCFIIGYQIYNYDAKGGCLGFGNWELDLSPLSEPEPTPVAQAAIECLEELRKEYCEYLGDDNDDEFYARTSTIQEIEERLYKLLRARVGETIKPL